jgi:hypothetical protein
MTKEYILECISQCTTKKEFKKEFPSELRFIYIEIIYQI